MFPPNRRLSLTDDLTNTPHVHTTHRDCGKVSPTPTKALDVPLPVWQGKGYFVVEPVTSLRRCKKAKADLVEQVLSAALNWFNNADASQKRSSSRGFTSWDISHFIGKKSKLDESSSTFASITHRGIEKS